MSVLIPLSLLKERICFSDLAIPKSITVLSEQGLSIAGPILCNCAAKSLVLFHSQLETTAHLSVPVSLHCSVLELSLCSSRLKFSYTRSLATTLIQAHVVQFYAIVLGWQHGIFESRVGLFASLSKDDILVRSFMDLGGIWNLMAIVQSEGASRDYYSLKVVLFAHKVRQHSTISLLYLIPI